LLLPFDGVGFDYGFIAVQGYLCGPFWDEVCNCCCQDKAPRRQLPPKAKFGRDCCDMPVSSLLMLMFIGSIDWPVLAFSADIQPAAHSRFGFPAPLHDNRIVEYPACNPF